MASPSFHLATTLRVHLHTGSHSLFARQPLALGCYRAQMTEKDTTGLTHINAEGTAQMVDVTDRAVTHRSAVVAGKVLVSSEVRELIASNAVSKGNVLEIARIASIMGAKKTPELIPLCHPIAISCMDVRQIGRAHV